MSNTNEYLQRIYAAIGGDINELPDNLKSTIYTAIILKCGGTVDDLPDGLETTYLKRILEHVQSGGGGSYEQGKADGEQIERDRFWNAALSNSAESNTSRFSGMCRSEEHTSELQSR